MGESFSVRSSLAVFKSKRKSDPSEISFHKSSVKK